MRLNFLFGLLLIIIGVLFLFENLGILEIKLWPILWPIIIILIGLKFLFATRRNEKSISAGSEENFPKEDKD
jgi:predicted membrane protein